jgi:hypothetical protein
MKTPVDSCFAIVRATWLMPSAAKGFFCMQKRRWNQSFAVWSPDTGFALSAFTCLHK